MASQPTVLVVDDERINRVFVERVLAGAGWDVACAADGAEAVAAARARAPMLVVMDIDMPVLDGWDAVAAIRAGDGPAASAPILAYTTLKVDDDLLQTRGFDGRIPKPCSPDELVALAASWRPNGEMAGYERLAAVFDASELEELLVLLREQLAAMLDGSGDTATAHRIAGAAGTLGFADVSASWLAVSHGEESALERAHHDTRRALAAIDRTLGERQSATAH